MGGGNIVTRCNRVPGDNIVHGLHVNHNHSMIVDNQQMTVSNHNMIGGSQTENENHVVYFHRGLCGVSYISMCYVMLFVYGFMYLSVTINCKGCSLIAVWVYRVLSFVFFSFFKTSG